MAASVGAATPAQAQASADYNCTITVGSISVDAPFSIEASTTAPASAPSGVTVNLTDIEIVFTDVDNLAFDDSAQGATIDVTLQPSGDSITMGPSDFDAGPPQQAIFTGGTHSFVLSGAPGTTVDVTIHEITGVVPNWPIAPFTANFTCALVSDPAVLASITVEPPPCLGEPATIVGGTEQTTVTGTPGDDVIVAQAPGATIAPGGGSDKVCAETGDGTVSYADSARGVIVVLSANGVLTTQGVDQLDGIVNAVGSPQTDGLLGDDSPNTLRGGDGNDVLNGRAGADVLDGEGGNDVIFGDSSDTCISGVPIGCSPRGIRRPDRA